MADKKRTAFRIAMRTADDYSGHWWIAFLAKIETMDDVIEIGRIRRSAAENPKVRAKFIETMQIVIEDILADKGIKIAEWQTQKPMPPSAGKA